MHASRLQRAAVGIAVVGFLFIPIGRALAHGDATQGNLEMEIGFHIEPAFTGSPNGVFFEAVHDGQGVTDIKPGDVTVEVSYGDETSDPMDLLPIFGGEPGQYLAAFVPSQPGKYTFHIQGTVDGEKVEETMSSGPATFATVENANDSAFPPVSAPSNEELASRIDQESARSEDALAAAEASALSADDAASSARTLGVIGVVLGAIGIVTGIIAITRRKA